MLPPLWNGRSPAAVPSVTAATVRHAGSNGAFIAVTMTDDGTDGDATASDGVFGAQVPAYTDDLPRYLFTYTLTFTQADPTDEDEDAGTTPTTLFINELMASNSTTVLDPQGDDDDWIELRNTGAAAIDLDGMYLSDSTSNPLKWRFPAGTTIDAGGYLLIWADDDDGDTPGLHTNFKLSAGGESVVLSDIDARANAVIDSVEFPAQTTDVSYGRTPEGTGPFEALAVASPGGPTPAVPEIAVIADGPATEGGTATLTVTAAPAPTADLVVQVAITQGADDDYLPSTLPTSVTVAADASETTLAVDLPDDSTDEPNGVLTVTLGSGTGYTVSETAGSASLTLRDDDSTMAGVVINELMASNGDTLLDPQGDADDWIELMNTSNAEVDLSGMYLSDDPADPKKWKFPAGTTIAAGGYLLIWADDDDGDTPGLHTNFKLSAGGETVVLSDTDESGNTVIDAVDFPALERDQSYGRTPEGTGTFQVLEMASPTQTPTVPAIAVTADGPATEGGAARFTIAARPPPDFALTVNVSVTQRAEDRYLPASLPTSAVIASGVETTTLSVTLPDDDVDEPNGVITATIAAGAGYRLDGAAAASLTVRDDDGGAAMSALAINELMASNNDTTTDPQGDDDDWIELRNNGAGARDLSGMYLSDDKSNPKKWRIPTGTTLAADAYLLVWADDDEGDSPGLHANFKLSAKGETVVLSDTDANSNALVDAVEFGALDDDEAYGRLPDGSGAFRTLPATPGEPNQVLPALAISAGESALEGGTATFTITADPAPADDLAVDVAITQEEGADYLPESPPATATIAAHARRTTLSVALPDDGIDEPDGIITATIQARSGSYDVTNASASMTVHDNDLPLPPLTATFVGVPARHDGRGLIRFEVRFSDDFRGRFDHRVLRDEALEVTNGTVREAGRAEPGQNRRWTIAVRPDSYRDVTVELPATTDCAAAGAVCVEDGRALSNGARATVAGPPPLTAEFVDVPARHDGADPFHFELRFSEEFAPQAGLGEALADSAFQVSNGAVRAAAHMEAGQTRRWTISVQPDSYREVTVVLPATSDCGAAAAVCAADGRPLSNRVSVTVAGLPALTAEFVDVPAEHDGRGLIRFEIRFSDDFRGRFDHRVLRDEALEVTNGTVREAGRAESGQNRRWTIGVRPDSYRDVTVELPATTDCAVAGAVCVEDGRALSNGARADRGRVRRR